ncbi:MAG: restriction endonuclease [Turicibacter sp.]|nr:restriction endonuclease [Turicibacter sp.]
MSKLKKLDITYLRAVLSLLILLLFFKIGGFTLVMIGFTLIVGCGAIYLSGEQLSFRKRKQITSINQLLQMSPYKFESYVAEFFREQGYTVFQTKRSNDGGKDLVMHKCGQTYYVECKRYAKSNLVSRPLIQKLVGACYPVGAVPIFITTSSFTKGAIAEARKSGVRLIDGHKLMRLIN